MTIIFPIAGFSSGLKLKFKPFREIAEETYIQAAYRSFSIAKHRITRVVFICLAEQEAEFSVRSRLSEFFPEISFDLILLQTPTVGPYDTVYQAFHLANLCGPCIICDCDHNLELAPLFNLIDERPCVDCIIPTWRLRGEDLKSWSVAAVDDNGHVLAIAEKTIPECTGHFVGVIGCYYFSDLGSLVRNISGDDHPYVSDAIRTYLRTKKIVKAVMLQTAYFFGDESRLRSVRSQYEPPRGTIFCDLDGTITEHQDIPSYEVPLKLLPGALEKLRTWLDAGYKIVITTARAKSEYDKLRHSLDIAGVTYHQLVMGLPSGPRYIINDRKPATRFTNQACAFEIERNQGIRDIQLPSNGHVHVVKRFRGGSMAETLLLEVDKKLFIRKRVSKQSNLSTGFVKLRQQYRALERFSKLADNLVPTLYSEHEDSLEYFYDMEYLPGYRMFHECPQEQQSTMLDKLLSTLQERIYSQRNHNACGEQWLEDHLTTKIYPKLELLQKNTILSQFVIGTPVILDGAPLYSIMESLRVLMSRAVVKRFTPRFLSINHGDLTYSNILFEGREMRIIDMDAGSSYFEAPELDLGKLLQSIIGRYEEWENIPGSLVTEVSKAQFEQVLQLAKPNDETVKIVLNRWAEILECSTDSAYERGLFYLGLHFIRMIPYRIRVSDEQALYAMVNAAKCLDMLAKNIKGQSKIYFLG